MMLFGKKNKSTKIEFDNNKGFDLENQIDGKATIAKSCSPNIKVLGSGCNKCKRLEAATIQALNQLGMDTAVDHVTDFKEIASYGVMATPALVVDGKVISQGKILKIAEIIDAVQKLRHQ